MKLYTCCPVDGCGAHADALNFLKSFGVEPSLQYDDQEQAHFLEFSPPKDERLKPFVHALIRRVKGMVLCYHGHEKPAKVFKVQCQKCRKKFEVCGECPVEEFSGCPYCG